MSETGSAGVSPDVADRVDRAGGSTVGREAGSTSDEAVNEALTRLVDLEEQPLRAHVAVFDAVHGALQDRLADAEG